MKPLAKGLLIGCGSIVLLGIVAVVAIGLYINSHGEEWMAAGKAAQEAGAKAGASLTDVQCVDGALSNYAKDRGMTGAVAARVWMAGCFGTARATPDLCVGVPAESEIIRSATWRIEQCDAHAAGLGGDSTCANILAEVQKQCGERAPAGG